MSAALQLLLLAAAGAQNSHGQVLGPNLLPLGGPAGGGNPAGQQPPHLPQLSQQQQSQQQQQQLPLQAGGPPARRGGAGPGGTGGGWKLAEEESCREDVTRVCPKHTWSNNLAVLECLQDVREVRRWDRPGRAEPGAGRRVSPAWNRGCRAAASLAVFLRGCARAFLFPAPHSRVRSGKRILSQFLPSPVVPYFAPCRRVLGSRPRLTASVDGGLGACFCLRSCLLCDALCRVASRRKPV